jgi:predicted nucleic acid-binding protein
VGIAELEEAIGAHRLLLIDTPVFSYHLSDHPRYAPLTAVILGAIESGKVAGLTSAVTVAEIMAIPAQVGDQQAMQDYELFLANFPNLRVEPLDVTLARETALVRAATGLRTPDAVQVAAARLNGADAIITNDHRWAARVTTPAVILLDAYLQQPKEDGAI